MPIFPGNLVAIRVHHKYDDNIKALVNNQPTFLGHVVDTGVYRKNCENAKTLIKNQQCCRSSPAIWYPSGFTVSMMRAQMPS